MIRNKRVLSTTEILERRKSAVALKRGYAHLLLRLVLIAAISYVVLTYGFAVLQVSGNEMLPSVKDGDLVIAYRLQKDFYHDDVVVYFHDGNKCVGRIAAVAGDMVEITDTGMLIVNGTTQSGEIYFVTYPKENGNTAYRVPENSYYILGDHRTSSTDSRDFGAVSAYDLIGKVISILRRRGI